AEMVLSTSAALRKFGADGQNSNGEIDKVMYKQQG
ncbi:MAG: hypothetical protein JWM11_3209, partial [Planctomycetaceae bacterium]|nr:hypothetical protein [Planctomycetaceae bacterium]